MHHHANGRFDWLISEHRSVNSLREATSVLSGKYKRFVEEQTNLQIQSSWNCPLIEVNSDNLLIYEYAYSLFISLCSVKSPITKLWQNCSNPHLKICPSTIFAFYSLITVSLHAYKTILAQSHLGGGGGGGVTCICRNTGMCNYFRYFFGVAPRFLGTFWAIPGFWGIIFWLLPDFWVSFFGKICFISE